MRKKEKRNCKSITIAEIITLKQNPRTRQPRTAVFMLSDSRTEGVAAAEKQDTLRVLSTAETQAKEVLLLFVEEIR